MRHHWQLPVFLALLVASGLLANLARARPSFAWDHPVAEWIVAIDVPGFHSAMEAVSVPGTTLGVLLSVLVATVAVLVWRGWRSATMTATIIVAERHPLHARTATVATRTDRRTPRVVPGTETASIAE